MVKVPLSTEMQVGPTNDTGICFDVATAKNLCSPIVKQQLATKFRKLAVFFNVHALAAPIHVTKWLESER